MKSNCYKIISRIFLAISILAIASCGSGRVENVQLSLSIEASVNESEVGTFISITWSSINSDRCDASGAWTGSKAITGSEDLVLASRGDNTFTLKCVDINKNIVTKTIIVTGFSMLEGVVNLGINGTFQIFLDTNGNLSQDQDEEAVKSDDQGNFRMRHSPGVVVANPADLENGTPTFTLFAAVNEDHQSIRVDLISSVDVFLSEPYSAQELFGFNAENSLIINAQLMILAMTLVGIDYFHEETHTVSTKNYKSIVGYLESNLPSVGSSIDISDFYFHHGVLSDYFEFYSSVPSPAAISDMAIMLTAVSRALEVKMEDGESRSVIDFFIGTAQNDMLLFLGDTADFSLPSKYQSDFFGYMAMVTGVMTSMNVELEILDNITIPLVDISSELSYQTIIDIESGQYLGHPTTVSLDDGNHILIVYPKGHGAGAIVYKESLDGGVSWSNRLPVPSSWSTSGETPTIYKLEYSGESSRLILFSGKYPIRSAISEDNGLNWSELEPIGDFGGQVAMSSLVKLRNGHFMAFFSDDGRYIDGSGVDGPEPDYGPDYNATDTIFSVYSTISEDNGLTWSIPEVMLRSNQIFLCEAGAIRSPDGNQIALLLRENKRAVNSHIIFSDDEGVTWSVPRELPAALTGDRHVAKYLGDGRVYITFRDRALQVNDTHGDWLAWIGSYDDLRYGAQGEYRIRLMDNKASTDAAYAGVEILPDGTVFSASYGHWVEGEQPYIVSVKVKPNHIESLIAADLAIFD